MAIHLVLAVTRESTMLVFVRDSKANRGVGNLDSGKEGSGVPWWETVCGEAVGRLIRAGQPLRLAFPGGSVVKNLPANTAPSLGWEDPLEKEWHPLQ